MFWLIQTDATVGVENCGTPYHESGCGSSYSGVRRDTRVHEHKVERTRTADRRHSVLGTGTTEAVLKRHDSLTRVSVPEASGNSRWKSDIFLRQYGARQGDKAVDRGARAIRALPPGLACAAERNPRGVGCTLVPIPNVGSRVQRNGRRNPDKEASVKTGGIQKSARAGNTGSDPDAGGSPLPNLRWFAPARDAGVGRNPPRTWIERSRSEQVPGRPFTLFVSECVTNHASAESSAESDDQ
jgi:hypothetical protein